MRLPNFDPSKSSKNTFISRVIKNKSFKLAEAKMRGGRQKAESLNQYIFDYENEIELIETITSDEGLNVR